MIIKNKIRTRPTITHSSDNGGLVLVGVEGSLLCKSEKMGSINSNPTSLKVKRLENWPQEVPRPTRYILYEFARWIPSENCQRVYRISYQAGLWSAFCVQFIWGRRGSLNMLSLNREFEKEDLARHYVERSILRRLNRGYILAGYQ